MWFPITWKTQQSWSFPKFIHVKITVICITSYCHTAPLNQASKYLETFIVKLILNDIIIVEEFLVLQTSGCFYFFKYQIPFFYRL